MTEVVPVSPVASIVSGPSTSGFVRNGRTGQFDIDVWRDSVKFESAPCDSPLSYPNKDAECQDLVDEDLVSDSDPKEEHSLSIDGPFFPWTTYENIVCETSDAVKDRHLELVARRVAAVRSGKFAQEFSGGGYSGSPSLASSATPLSSTSYTLTEAIQRLYDARVQAGAGGPHYIHIPSVLEPLASALTLSSTDDYRLVFDNYTKTYTPGTNISGGGAATAPSASQAWVGITGPYEYEFSSQGSDSVKTIDSRNKNRMFVQAEEKLWFRFETCNSFLAKVTVFS